MIDWHFLIQWEFGPLDEWKSVDNLEAELKEWNSFFARAVANPSAKLKSMIANLVDDAILEGFFQSWCNLYFF